jgi:hypothetical protein
MERRKNMNLAGRPSAKDSKENAIAALPSIHLKRPKNIFKENAKMKKPAETKPGFNSKFL